MESINQLLFGNRTITQPIIEKVMEQFHPVSKKLSKEINFHESQLARLDGTIFYRDVYNRSYKNPLLQTRTPSAVTPDYSDLSEESTDEESNVENLAIHDKKLAVKLHLKNLIHVYEIIPEFAERLEKETPESTYRIGQWFAHVLRRWDIAALCYRDAAHDHYQPAIDKLTKDYMKSEHMTYHARMVLTQPPKALKKAFKQLPSVNNALFFQLCEHDDWTKIREHLGPTIGYATFQNKLVRDESSDEKNVIYVKPAAMDTVIKYAEKLIKNRLTISDHAAEEDTYCSFCSIL
jgi:hypothetical protein